MSLSLSHFCSENWESFIRFNRALITGRRERGERNVKADRE